MISCKYFAGEGVYSVSQSGQKFFRTRQFHSSYLPFDLGVLYHKLENHTAGYFISFFPNCVTASAKNRTNTAIAHGRNNRVEKAASEASDVKSWSEHETRYPL